MVKEDTVWENKSTGEQRQSTTGKHIFKLTFTTHSHISSKHIRFVGKRGICAQHRLLFDTVAALLALVGERQSRDVLISIVISTVELSLHA